MNAYSKKKFYVAYVYNVHIEKYCETWHRVSREVIFGSRVYPWMFKEWLV